MFKFIHCADLHLDSPLRGLSAKPDAPVDEIRSATRRALENLVELCISESVSFLIIAGDVYDGDWPDYSTGLFFNSQMAKLKEHGIPVYLIRGNHDAQSQITRRLTMPENVYEFPVDKPATKILELKEDQVAIHGQGYKEREVLQNLTPYYPDPLPNYYNIGILHTSLEGHEGHEPYAPCRLDDLITKGYDYWALGHIHKRQIFSENPHILYPGNIQGRHIKETGKKGCTLVTVNGKETLIEHRVLDVLRWFECMVDLSNVHNDSQFIDVLSEKFTEIVEDNIGYPLAIRVQLIGNTKLHQDIIQDQEKYRHEIMNAANMVSSQIWIEKVKFNTEFLSEDSTRSEQNKALSKLIQSSNFTDLDEAFIQDFLSHVQSIQPKLSSYMKRNDATKIEREDQLQSLVKDAQDLLLALLLKGGKS